MLLTNQECNEISARLYFCVAFAGSWIEVRVLSFLCVVTLKATPVPSDHIRTYMSSYYVRTYVPTYVRNSNFVMNQFWLWIRWSRQIVNQIMPNQCQKYRKNTDILGERVRGAVPCDFWSVCFKNHVLLMSFRSLTGCWHSSNIQDLKLLKNTCCLCDKPYYQREELSGTAPLPLGGVMPYYKMDELFTQAP